MAKPNSKDTLKDYCLRALGAPVIEVNIDDDQLDDRVDESLQFYQHYHQDAIEKFFLVHTVTSTDITNGYIPINDLITDVVRLMPINDSTSGDSMFDVRYQIHLNDLYNLGFMGSLAEYVMSMEYLNLLDTVVDSDEKHISFERHKDRLTIHMDWSEEVAVGDKLVVEAYRIIDPDTYTQVYDDYYLKKYCTALIKKQWGLNLLKFEGMQMPGGVTFNGRQLYDDAIADLEKLEEEARLNWEAPVDFYTG
tara:strand:+ start:147 stop:896 length:750 start_codon:yes stop_codon:yes gene_type:complete